MLGAFALAAPGVASAAFRYAEPGGTGADPCSAAGVGERCSIETAVSGAASGDFVMLANGNYPLSALLTIPAGVTLMGAPADPESVTLSTVLGNGVQVTGTGAEIRDLTVVHTGIQVALGVYNGATATRVISKSSGSFSCDVNASLIRNSYCLNTSGNGAALSNAKSLGATTATAVNVTAVSTGGSSYAVWGAATTSDATLNAFNVIALSAGNDVGASAQTGFTATIQMAFSNFATVNGFGGGTTNITLPDTPTNQSDPPLLADPTNGDPRQLPDSPTIDAGETAGGQDVSDLFGAARIVGDNPDIGAVEFDPAPTAKITGKPKKRTRARTARFKFEADEKAAFTCKLDNKPATDCGSRKTYRHLKPGRHKFTVIASDEIDQEGRASYKWRVLKPHNN